MAGQKRCGSLCLGLVVLLAGCAAPGAGSHGASSTGSVPTATAGGTMKRIVLGTTLEQDLRPTTPAPQRIVQPLVHSGLTVGGTQRMRHPLLAAAVPSLENDLWKLLPDGRMETTWRLRDGTRWHDGAPLTAEDLLFSLEVGRDREMSAFSNQAYASIEEVSAPDPRTLTIAWKAPFIEADAVLDARPVGPLPKHLLEDAYRADKSSFIDLAYWTHEFVGAGPYRIREWAPGIGIRLDANREYALGRPKIDHIEVKHVPDANTLMANLLAGTVDITNGVGSIDLGIQLRDQWRDGTVAFNFGSNTWVALFPQFVDPRPAAVADAQVRRALAHGIDRQEMADTLVAGMSPVPHSFLGPNQAEYRDIEVAVPRYDYDPRRAAQMLESRGYWKGTDGTYRDEANRRLELEIRSGFEQTAKAALAVANYWQRLGVEATAVRLSPQQAQDLQYVATFPAFSVEARPNDVNGLRFLHSSETRLPSNNFRARGVGNTSRYMIPEFDSLLEAYFKTVPVPEGVQVLGQIIRHVADHVTLLGLHYSPAPGAIAHRVLNVSREWPTVFITWNAHEWDVKSG